MVEVEIFHKENRATVFDPDKVLSKLHVTRAPGGYIFFQVQTEKGKLPQELSGKYSSLHNGISAVETYLNNRPKSRGKRSKEYLAGLEERIEKKHAAETVTESN